MLQEWNKVKHLFRRPKAHFYFGFWGVPHFISRMAKYCLDTKEDTLRKRIYSWFVMNTQTFQGLPVWRRGNFIRLFSKKQIYDAKISQYIWAPEFQETLNKYHLAWLKPGYELPLWMSCYFFKHDMMWKWKYDDVRYEFPPQITLVLFNVAFGVVWTAPKECKDDFDNDDMYWESILNYNYKFDRKDVPNFIFELSDYLGHYTRRLKEKNNVEYIWQLQPCFLKHEMVREELYKYQIKRTADLLETREKVICPKCNSILHKNKDVVLTTFPPQYEYICPKCGYKKHMFDDIETWKIL